MNGWSGHTAAPARSLLEELYYRRLTPGLFQSPFTVDCRSS